MEKEVPYNLRTETKACAHCSQLFTGHPDRLYCSPRCKRRTPLSREIEHTCKECKLPFMGHPNAMFCSDSCKTQYHNPHKDEECEGFNINNPWGPRLGETVIAPTLEEELSIFSFHQKKPLALPTLIKKPIPGYEDRILAGLCYAPFDDALNAVVIFATAEHKDIYKEHPRMPLEERLEVLTKRVMEGKFNSLPKHLSDQKILS